MLLRFCPSVLRLHSLQGQAIFCCRTKSERVAVEEAQAASLQSAAPLNSEPLTSPANDVVAQAQGPTIAEGDRFSSEAEPLDHEQLPTTSQSPASAAKWPWLDPNSPQLLPKFVKRSKEPVPILQGLQIVKDLAQQRKRKFVESVEIHAKLAVDPRQGDQMVRGAVVLPAGSGKTVRVCVFARGADAESARAAGADVIGDESLIKQIMDTKGGCIDFDRIVATPDFMKLLAPAGKVLGPKGLMPNPKVGTVTTNVVAVVNELKRGRVEFRIDKQALLHVAVGKVNFELEDLHANVGALTAALLDSKPKAVKGGPGLTGYVERVHLCSSMGQSVPIAPASLLAAMDAFQGQPAQV